MTRPAFADLVVGQEVGTRDIHLDRARLVRYAGASGDLNPIHWDESFAVAVGLPGVIAHGMLTMGAVVALVVDWAGDPGAVVDYQTRFSAPVPVPASGDVVVAVTATVGALDPSADGAPGGVARIDLLATCEGQRVLAKAQARVRL